MKIVYTQRAITPKQGKPELRSCVLHFVLWCLTFVRSFMKMCQAVLNLWSGHETIVNTQRAITPKVGKPELRFMCSACHLMVFNVV